MNSDCFLTHRRFFTILAITVASIGDERSIDMHGKHTKKLPKRTIFRTAGAFVLVLALSVSSLVTVFANTVSASVIDGGETYSFVMNSASVDDIIAKAEYMGMPALGSLDISERVGNTTTVNVRRGVFMTLTEGGTNSEFVVYKGDTVEKALENNGVFLNDKDEITPNKDTEITGDVAVHIKRHCEVTVSADGKTYPVALTGGYVKDALKEARITLGADDGTNYLLDALLVNGMQINVRRVVALKITADGATKEYKMSADTVKTALENAEIALGADDEVTPKLTAKVKDGTEIVVKRVEVKAEKETEAVPFETVTEKTGDLYVDQTKVKTEGVNGEKEITYDARYIDGVLDSREVKNEETVKAPVNKVVLQGTKAYPAETPAVTAPSETGGSSSAADGTVTDASGTAVSYYKSINGTGSAYCDVGTTASGNTAGWGYVAVNPNVIPYGTKLYIRSSDGAYERYAVASDTGGALLSGRILVDLWFPTLGECTAFGLRNIEVYFLN